MHGREVSLLDWNRRTVIDHYYAHAAQRGDQPLDSGRVVPHGDNYGYIAVRRAAGGPWVGNGRVEQRARHLRAHRVVHLQPAPIEHCLCDRGQP